MAIGAKHVLVVALVTLLLTYVAYRGKFPSHGDAGVSVAGRKGLSDAQFSEKAPMVAEDSVTETEIVTTKTTPVVAEDSVTETESATSEDATVETVDGGALSSEQSTEESSEETSEQTSLQTSEEAIGDSKEEVSDLEVAEEPAIEESEETTTSAEEATPVEESWNSDVRTGENVDFSAETSEEAPFEGNQVRELEAMSPGSGLTTAMENVDSSNYPIPKDNPDVYLQEIARDNAAARQNEGLIQSCIKEDGCGTPDP